VLTSLGIDWFKCFDQVRLRLAPLTLLAGVNGGGKSSAIQALVLLHQSMVCREWGRSLLLEGPELALGTAADVLDQVVGARHLQFHLETARVDGGSESVSWLFATTDRRALAIALRGVLLDGAKQSLDGPIRWLLPERVAGASVTVDKLRRLGWLTAERSGPREVYPLRDADGHVGVGHRGEFAAGLLYWRESDEVSPVLCVPEVPPTLFHQTRAQMQRIFPGCDFRVSAIDGASALTLRFRTDPRADFQRPQNVGFGLTQVFPIVVALLAAHPGDLILVENPEVHLHPAAQQQLGGLAARAAASGVQLIVETHSDHVLNGVRLAVKRWEIEPDAVAVHFFGASPPGGSVEPVSPQIDRDGRLDQWPDGFFDQLDLALSELL